MNEAGISAFIETLRARKLFAPGASLVIARAPGRLDVMGGIADYSGSLVLQRPIREATLVAVERIAEPAIEITSFGRKPCTLALNAVNAVESYEDARSLLGAAPDHHWVAYVAGVFFALVLEREFSFSSGARIAISSSVAAGKGVSSSAAIETATLEAVTRAFDIPMEPMELALLCQKAENLVAGAPCGVMDQVTCVFGEKDRLLALLCQPAELQPFVDVPGELSFWGLDSGERHAVSGSDYGAVRTGAFMGHRLIAALGGGPHPYLAGLSAREFEMEYRPHLPEQISGREFLSRYGNITDTVTRVDPMRMYKVRQPTAHPVLEYHRALMFQQLLLAPGEQQRKQLGDLMLQSHSSYAACGLSSRGTDLIVNLVRKEGAANGLYGARVTGGGCGGTVAVVGRRDAGPAITRVADSYEKMTGYHPYVFEGSSDGVLKSGWSRVTI